MQGWTVLFFIYVEDEETAGYANELMRELLQIYPGDQLTLLVFESVYDQDTPEKISGTLVELVHKGDVVKRQKKLLKTFRRIDPGNTNVLAAVLRYITDKKLLRDRFGLFTWDHGAGFGIFSNDPRPVNNREFMQQSLMSFMQGKTVHSVPATAPLTLMTNRRTRLLNAQPANNISLLPANGFQAEVHLKSAMKSITIPVNMLTATEINEALKVLGRRADVVIMMNCWVQMLETGSELSDTANALVAPESIYYFAGYDYFTILNSIVFKPQISGEAVARIAVESVAGKFREDIRWEPHLREVVVSAVRPKKAKMLFEAINNAFAPLSKLDRKTFQRIRKIRRNCLDFSANYYFSDGKPDNSLLNYFIDLVHYASILAEQGLVQKKSFTALRNAAQDYVLHIFRGDLFNKKSGKNGTLLANGFSVFHPDKREPDFDEQLYYPYFYGQKRIKMAHTSWATFLEAYRKIQ